MSTTGERKFISRLCFSYAELRDVYISLARAGKLEGPYRIVVLPPTVIIKPIMALF